MRTLNVKRLTITLQQSCCQFVLKFNTTYKYINKNKLLFNFQFEFV